MIQAAASSRLPWDFVQVSMCSSAPVNVLFSSSPSKLAMKEESPIHIENATGLGSAAGSLEAVVPLAGHLKPRLSKLNMVGFSFAILK
jgi:hypothetical protein